jgi:hypothetical protein
MATRAEVRPIRSIEDVHEPAVRAAIEELIARPETLGFLFCGSRATGWASPDGDYDGFVYVTREHYRSLDVDATQIRMFAENETPKRMTGDFSSSPMKCSRSSSAPRSTSITGRTWTP